MTSTIRSTGLKSARGPLVLAALLWLSLGGQARAQVMPPSAANDMTMTSSTSPVTVDVLSNDTGGTYPIDSTSVEIVTPPALGSTSVNPSTGAITYTPVAGTSGQVNFQYAVRDTHGNPSSPAQVSVYVMHTPPYAANDSSMVAYNQSVAINVLANDMPGTAPIDPATVVIVTQPTRGSVSVNATTGVVTYTPTGNAPGSDSFQYRVSDQQGIASNTASVNVAVINNPPHITSFYSRCIGSNFVEFYGVVSDEEPAQCTVHLGQDVNVDVTPDAQGNFNYVQQMSHSWGMVTAKATDPAGQQSQQVSVMYYCY